jgi:tRNA nucleotidyltransferase/poly(A) polymerase
MLNEKLNKLNIDQSRFEQVFTPNVRKVADVLRKYGFDVRVVGGAVRDFLIGEIPRDIDFATDADPSELIYIFNLENIEHDDWGINHGTVKAVFPDEVVDVTSIAYKLELKDGKMRIIRGQDWEQDAQHRDFSINSMSIDQDGVLYDYTDGINDIHDSTVRMNPITLSKLEEDPHLILRWFKAIGKFEHAIWPVRDYKAIVKSIPALAKIKDEEKTEREISGIITGKNGMHILTLMCKMGAGKYVGIDCDL